MGTRARKTAFSLVELLVVIAIMSLLAAILFPVFAKARENARRASCQSNLKQLGLAVAQYTQDNDGIYPISTGGPYGAGGGTQWDLLVEPYAKTLNIFLCPDDAQSATPAPVGSNWAGIMLSYASNSECGFPGPSYGLTLQGVFGLDGSQFGPQTFANGSEIAITTEGQVTKPAETVMLVEKHSADIVAAGDNYGISSGYGANMMFTGVGNFGWAITGDDLPSTSNSGLAWGTGADGGVSASHLSTANFLFCDGHVKALIPYETRLSGNDMWNARR